MPNGPPSRSLPAMRQHRELSLVTACPRRIIRARRATMRESAATATFCTTHAAETGAGGHRRRPARVAEISFRRVDRDRLEHAFVPADVGRQDREQAGEQPHRASLTRVQLIKPGACGEIPVMSRVSAIPLLDGGDRDLIEPVGMAVVLEEVRARNTPSGNRARRSRRQRSRRVDLGVHHRSDTPAP